MSDQRVAAATAAAQPPPVPPSRRTAAAAQPPPSPRQPPPPVREPLIPVMIDTNRVEWFPPSVSAQHREQLGRTLTRGRHAGSPRVEAMVARLDAWGSTLDTQGNRISATEELEYLSLDSMSWWRNPPHLGEVYTATTFWDYDADPNRMSDRLWTGHEVQLGQTIGRVLADDLSDDVRREPLEERMDLVAERPDLSDWERACMGDPEAAQRLLSQVSPLRTDDPDSFDLVDAIAFCVGMGRLPAAEAASLRAQLIDALPLIAPAGHVDSRALTKAVLTNVDRLTSRETRAAPHWRENLDAVAELYQARPGTPETVLPLMRALLRDPAVSSAPPAPRDLPRVSAVARPETSVSYSDIDTRGLHFS